MVIKNDLGIIRIAELSGRSLTIGRSSESDLILDHEGISRNHARLDYRDSQGWYLIDNHSVNGVFVNGEPIQEIKLTTGDIIEIRPFTLDYLECEKLEGSDVEMTVTSATLLSAIKDPQDSRAWGRFNARYHPMIIAFARKLGLSLTDAEDVGQEALMAFVQMYLEGRYDREKGRLRSWLFGIVHRKVVDLHRKQGREIAIGNKTEGPGLISQVEFPENKMEAVWEEEWQYQVLKACLQEVAKEVKPQTLAAFELYVLKQWPVEKVAAHLGMTVSSIYTAKTRILDHIQRVKQQIEEIW
jgi:RNA polymerase sigma-70 factor (ECF subfamily)